MRKHGLRAKLRTIQVGYFLAYMISRAIAARIEQERLALEARLKRAERIDDVLRMMEEERKRVGNGDDRYLWRPNGPQEHDRLGPGPTEYYGHKLPGKSMLESMSDDLRRFVEGG